MMDRERLVTMANQIARNFEAQGEARAIAATAQHIRDFWDPRMKIAIVAPGAGELSPIAAQAVAALEI